MAPPISRDLRERVVETYLQGEETYAEVAERFGVGEASVSRWLRLHRETGAVEPLGHRGGAPRRIRAEQEPLVEQLVLAHPDWTEAELSAALRAEHGIEASAVTVGRVVRRLGYGVKKRRSSPPSEIGPTSPSDESSTSTPSKPSPLRVWFLWTKPARTSR